MRWRITPALWLPVALALVVLAGSFALRSRVFVQQSERDATAYGERPVWLATFDAISATCGVGLLMFDVEREYTASGRWLLIALCLAGGTLVILAVQQCTVPMRLPAGERWPQAGHVLLGFVVLTVAGSILAGASVAWTARQDGAFWWGAWHGASAVTSAGVSNQAELSGGRRLIGVLALVSACVWPLWLALGSKAWVWSKGKTARVPGAPGACEPASATEGRRYITPASVTEGRGYGAWWRLRALALVGSYVVWLLLAAGLLTLLESPRGALSQPGMHGRAEASTQQRSQERLSRLSPSDRFRECFTQIEAASGAGLQTLTIRDRAIGEGSKLVLAAVVLVGPLLGAPGGGVSWNVVVWVLAAAAVSLRRRGAADPVLFKLKTAAVALVAAVVAFWLIVAVGLFVIENRVGSPFRAPPTLGDVLLESASAVAGAGITTGLTADLTAATLSSGIAQNVDVYQYGMTWLMGAMFIGRILPVLVLARMAAVVRNAECGMQNAEFGGESGE